MYYLVVDIGSSNGKIYLIQMDEKKIRSMKEVDRFSVERTFFQGHIRTNIFYIYDRICEVIKKLSEDGVKISAMGIDSWCCDYGLVDLDSGSVSMPVFYRDAHTDGYLKKITKIMDAHTMYRLTTQRKIENSTLCQLLAYKKEYPKGLEGNKKLLFLGDILMYLFTGSLQSEISAASYSQLFSMKKEAWEREMFQVFDIPESLCPPIVHPGTVIGAVTESLQTFLGTKQLMVVTPAVHDTASAAAAIPAEPEENWAFLATGSWFLMSMEMKELADIEKSFQYQLSNTGMAFGKVLLKKNITAMWLVQECKRQWEKMGLCYTYSELAKKAEDANAFFAVLNTEHASFYHPLNMVQAICKYLKDTGQQVPEESDVGQIVRIIYESIAFKTKEALDMLLDTTGKPVDVLYVIGGANRIAQLNQFLADATGRLVKTGPSEATAVGNALLQAYGMKEIHSEEEMRQMARDFCLVEEYRPVEHLEWKRRYKEWKRLCGVLLQ